jgi:hypothetical protein
MTQTRKGTKKKLYRCASLAQVCDGMSFGYAAFLRLSKSLTSTGDVVSSALCLMLSMKQLAAAPERWRRSLDLDLSLEFFDTLNVHLTGIILRTIYSAADRCTQAAGKKPQLGTCPFLPVRCIEFTSQWPHAQDNVRRC